MQTTLSGVDGELEESSCLENGVHMTGHENMKCHEMVLQNTLELLRIVGLHMVQKSLHTADCGLHRAIFGLHMVCTS